MTRRSNQFLLGLRDFLVLLMVFAAVNFFLHRRDPGWLELNPTPWLVPVALIGARYGFVGGLFSGLVVSLGIAGVRVWMSDDSLRAVLRAHDFTYLAIAIAGAATGEISAVLSKRRRARENQQHHAAEENARLRSQLEIVDEARHSLQKQLALYNAPLASLDNELRELFRQPRAAFLQSLLLLLHRRAEINSAGIYVIKGEALELEAVVHQTAPLKPSLILDHTPIAVSARKEGKLTMVKDVVSLSEQQPFLAALPFGSDRVILVQDMPFDCFDKQHLARAELMVNWAAAIYSLDIQSGRQSVSPEVFYRLLQQACQVDQFHALPSTLLHIESLENDDVKGLLTQLPETAMVAKLSQSNTVAVLLPFMGDGEVDKLIAMHTRPASGQRAHHYLLTRGVEIGALWQSLNGGGGKV